MTPAELGPWIGAMFAALGGGAGIVALVKARPEAKKIDADAARVIQDASAAWVQGVSSDLKELREKVAALEREREERNRCLRVHEGWDRTVAQTLQELGKAVPPPPPLYPDPTVV